MKILVTSPRAPVVLEWIQIAKRAGHQVTIVDTLRFPLCAGVLKAEYKRISSPRFDFINYQKSIINLIESHDFVIPTCEDIFYLTKAICDLPELKKKVFAPNFNLLTLLHHKYHVQQLLNEYVQFPSTRLLTSAKQIDFSDQGSILKPVFSRFGSSVVTEISRNAVSHIVISEQQPWVQQHFVEGESLCNYAVIEHGIVVDHVVYKPKYLINNAAATYFEYVEEAACDAFIETFAKQYNYHGQVAFDFIKNEEGLFVIECNPRATSGLHLLSPSINFLPDGTFQKTNKQQIKCCRLGASLLWMFTYRSLVDGNLNTMLFDYKKAKNILLGVGLVQQLLAFTELFIIAKRNNITIAKASAYDIEYNG
jgi:glutathione synthase/RimK-type ligase-like ATP-grasp enzyme